MNPRSPLRTFGILLASALFFGLLTQGLARPGNWVDRPRFLEEDAPAREFLRSDVNSAGGAKRKRLFWIESTGGEGFGVNALASPALFSSLFPGYPGAMRTDEDLWHDYFQRTFEIDAFTNGLSKGFAPEFNVILSWVGCLDIYKRYGADLVVMGTSETFRSIVVDELAAKTATDQIPKVLLCTASAMQVETATEFARRLREARPDLRPAVLYGQSLSTAFVEGRHNLKNGREKRETLANLDLQLARSRHGLVKFFEAYHEVSFADLFPKITWDDLFPVTSSARIDNAWIAEYPALARAAGKAKVKGGYVPASLRMDGEALSKDIASRIQPYYRFYEDYEDSRHCRSAERRRQFAELGRALRALSDRIYLYVPPTTPLAFRAATDCFREQVFADVEALGRSIRAPVLAQEWDAYGLEYSDYLRPTFHPEVYKIDIQHPNYMGALKVTNALAQWMNGPSEGEDAP